MLKMIVSGFLMWLTVTMMGSPMLLIYLVISKYPHNWLTGVFVSGLVLLQLGCFYSISQNVQT